MGRRIQRGGRRKTEPPVPAAWQLYTGRVDELLADQVEVPPKGEPDAA